MSLRSHSQQIRCNKCLVHKDYPQLQSLLDTMFDSGVEVRGCPKVTGADSRVVPATDLDWDTEYLDLILSIKIVESMDESIAHIDTYGSGHSEAILTSNYMNSNAFIHRVDSAAVFINASTRFHDGGEFGLGAEVGISTQKLHARGAMGIEGLTTEKYIVFGHGESR